MKVLLTGANGFVGSHILDLLRARAVPTAVLLRPTSNRRFIAAHGADLDVRPGSIDDPASLAAALDGVTHVLHCAGCTKALRLSDFDRINHAGTGRVVDAVNQAGARLQRLVYVSSLAAAGPAGPGAPARESDPPRPDSASGRSKLAGERAVQEACRTEHVILRPAAVYGPRDVEFLRMFRAIGRHLGPRPRPQPLSLTFVRDFAAVAVAALTHPAAAGKLYHVASPEIVTARAFADEVAAQMKTWMLPLPLPAAALGPLCWLQDGLSRITGRPNVLSRQKIGELRAPGWVCDVSRLQQDLGIVCATRLQPGIAETLAWYRQEGWL